MLKKSKSAYWLYFLGAYVIIQFVWWGYHLIQLSCLFHKTTVRNFPSASGWSLERALSF